MKWLKRHRTKGRQFWSISLARNAEGYECIDSLVFVGDFSLARKIEAVAKAARSFDVLSNLPDDVIGRNDILVINNEYSLSTTGDRWEPKPETLRAGPEVLRYIEDLCPTVIVNLANNHFLDFGEKGALQSLSLFRDHGIEYFGIATANNPFGYITKVVGEARVGLVSFAPAGHRLAQGSTVNLLEYDSEFVQEAVATVSKEADIVIVSLHQGIEYSSFVPRKSRLLARRCIDGGASVVVCHHSHTVNGLEWYKGKPIFHGIGNFLMDTESSSHKFASYGLIVRVCISGRNIKEILVDAIKQGEEWKPTLLEQAEFESLEKYVSRHSRLLGSAAGQIVNDLIALLAWMFDRGLAVADMVRRKGWGKTIEYYRGRLSH